MYASSEFKRQIQTEWSRPDGKNIFFLVLLEPNKHRIAHVMEGGCALLCCAC